MFWQNTAQKQPVGASINIACYPEEDGDRTNKYDWQEDDIDPNHQQSATTEATIKNFDLSDRKSSQGICFKHFKKPPANPLKICPWAESRVT